MNVVLFAADSRCFQYLLPVARVLNDRGHNYLFMANQTTPLIHPLKENLHHFQFYSNVENSDEYGITSDTLNINLPFKPDVVILARENWNPEQSIIREFKERFNSTVCLVEVNTHLINVIEAKMEMLSRNKYPQNMIDVFFDQHQESVEARIESGWDGVGKSIVVGNPLLDLVQNKRYPAEILKNIRQKYKIDENKKQIIFYGLINVSRKESLKALENISKNAGDEYQIFYKGYPGEPYNEGLKDIFYKDGQQGKFYLENVTPIYDHIDMIGLQVLCDIHVGAISSVMSVPLYLNKLIININNICEYLESGNNLETYKNESDGFSDGSAKFWMNVHKDIKEMNTFEDFVELVNLDDLDKFKERNKKFIELIKATTYDYDEELSCLKQEPKDNSELFNKFHETNEVSVGERITNYLEAQKW